ncbi:MAG: helix-turn-helix transcriptional regulator [Firmicutes bacterium]|nr:helix-turn-helix transcriptional regulator [Bacillota bacterium]
MKQLELASLLRVTRQAISRYEIGDRDMSPDTIAQECRIFDCTADYLLGLSTQRTAGVTEADARLLRAYHAAPEPIRRIVDTALEDYAEKKEPAAG